MFEDLFVRSAVFRIAEPYSPQITGSYVQGLHFPILTFSSVKDLTVLGALRITHLLPAEKHVASIALKGTKSQTTSLTALQHQFS